MGNYSDIYKIYENKSAQNKVLNYFDTILDRKNFLTELRGILEKDNYTDLTLLANGQNILLSNLQILNNTAFHTSRYVCKDFLRYISAYPIVLDTKTRFVKNAENSSNFYIKIYRNENIDDFYLYCKKAKLNNETSPGIFKEFYYYKYIYTNIFSKNICPNFLNIVSMCVDNSSKINWDVTNKTGAIELDRFVEDNKNKSIIIVTEAPTIDLRMWQQYTFDKSKYGNHNLISSGYHTELSYTSVIFQMLYTILTLVKHRIIFSTITLDNFFIRVVTPIAKNNKYEYIINGISYYIPYEYYILVFDSIYFKNALGEAYEKEQYVFFDKHNTITIDRLDAFVTSLYSLFNPADFFNHVGSSVPPEIRNLLHNISPVFLRCIERYNSVRGDIPMVYDIIEKTIKSIIYDNSNFKVFLHPRIGTNIYKHEKDLIIPIPVPDFLNIKNKLLVFQIRHDKYIWVLYKEACTTIVDAGSHIVIIKENNMFSVRKVHNTNLYEYTGPFIPLDEYDKINIDDIEILDTYNIDI